MRSSCTIYDKWNFGLRKQEPMVWPSTIHPLFRKVDHQPIMNQWGFSDMDSPAPHSVSQMSFLFPWHISVAGGVAGYDGEIGVPWAHGGVGSSSDPTLMTWYMSTSNIHPNFPKYEQNMNKPQQELGEMWSIQNRSAKKKTEDTTKHIQIHHPKHSPECSEESAEFPLAQDIAKPIAVTIQMWLGLQQVRPGMGITGRPGPKRCLQRLYTMTTYVYSDYYDYYDY